MIASKKCTTSKNKNFTKNKKLIKSTSEKFIEENSVKPINNNNNYSKVLNINKSNRSIKTDKINYQYNLQKNQFETPMKILNITKNKKEIPKFSNHNSRNQTHLIPEQKFSSSSFFVKNKFNFPKTKAKKDNSNINTSKMSKKNQSDRRSNLNLSVCSVQNYDTNNIEFKGNKANTNREEKNKKPFRNLSCLGLNKMPSSKAKRLIGDSMKDILKNAKVRKKSQIGKKKIRLNSSIENSVSFAKKMNISPSFMRTTVTKGSTMSSKTYYDSNVNVNCNKGNDIGSVEAPEEMHFSLVSIFQKKKQFYKNLTKTFEKEDKFVLTEEDVLDYE